MNMCVKTAKAKIREEIKKQIALLSTKEKERQSKIVVDKVRIMIFYLLNFTDIYFD